MAAVPAHAIPTSRILCKKLSACSSRALVQYTLCLVMSPTASTSERRVERFDASHALAARKGA